MMRGIVWVTLTVGALAFALAALTACRAPDPTPTPTPAPTPPPTPTPTPTSTEQLNQQAAWLANPPDAAHWIARTAIRRIAVEDETLGQQVAALPWSVDGITADEAGVLDDLSWLLQQDPAIAAAVLDFSWMSATANITADDRRALRAVRAAVDADSALGATLASYPWFETPVTPEGADALETLAELVAPDFQSQTVTGIGAMRLRPPSPTEPPHLEFAQELAEINWLQDEITGVEPEALNAWAELIQVEEPSGDAALETVWRYNWTRDDATQAEVKFISDLSEVAASTDDRNADALETIMAYGWVRNGIAQSESGWILRYQPLLEDAGPEDADALPLILDYAWVRDGLRAQEVGHLSSLRSIFRYSSAENAPAIRTVFGYPWLADSITSDEIAVLRDIASALSATETVGAAHVNKLLGYGWVSDDITADESAGFGLLSDTLRMLGRDYPEAAQSVLAYEWVQDDLVDSDLVSLRALFSVFRHPRDQTGDFTVALTARPWLQDGLDEDELALLGLFDHSLRSVPAGTIMPPALAAYPWLDGGISSREEQWLIDFLQVLAAGVLPDGFDAVQFSELPWFQDGIDEFEASATSHLAWDSTLRDPDILSKEWFQDGLSEQDMVLLRALVDAKWRSEHHYPDLLDSPYIANKTLTLLHRELEVYVVGSTQFKANDPTMGLIEDIALKLEEFMALPFPRDNIVIFYWQPAWSEGQTPRFGLGHAGLAFFTLAPPHHNRNYHLAVFHEMAHAYWGGHTGAPPWWNEGAAGFLPDYARDALGQETLDERRADLLEDTERECWSWRIANISEYYHIQETNRPLAERRSICIYAFGELFLMEMYLLLGHDAVSTAMRQLYVDARDSDWQDPITDQKIYDAFLANTPQDKLEDFHNLFDDIHGGAKVTLQDS